MKFFNVLGTVTRYLLAAVSCISLAQFLLLLNVGTENAGRVAGQSLGSGVITGLVAAVLFYRARRVSPRVSANVQTQVQVTPPPKSQAQSAAPSLDSVSATSPASILTADDSDSSFEQQLSIARIVAVVGVVASVLLLLVWTGMFQQPWTLSAGASQPRFIHIQGTPSSQMYDNRTGQACVSSPVVYDSFSRVRADFRKMFYEEAEHDQVLRVLTQHEEWVSQAVDTLDSADSDQHYNSPAFQELYRRYDALKANPEHPPVYHTDGMPYCKEL
jgi:hypothetical protein